MYNKIIMNGLNGVKDVRREWKGSRWSQIACNAARLAVDAEQAQQFGKLREW